MSTKPRRIFTVIRGQVFIGTKTDKYTIWSTLESILAMHEFFKPMVSSGPLESHKFIFLDDMPNVNTVEVPY